GAFVERPWAVAVVAPRPGGGDELAPRGIGALHSVDGESHAASSRSTVDWLAREWRRIARSLRPHRRTSSIALSRVVNPHRFTARSGNSRWSSRNSRSSICAARFSAGVGLVSAAASSGLPAFFAARYAVSRFLYPDAVAATSGRNPSPNT